MGNERSDYDGTHNPYHAPSGPPSYTLVICGADDEHTGRDKIVQRFLGPARQKTTPSPSKRLVDIYGTPTVLEVLSVGPSWCHSPMLEYHGHYAHAFVFAFGVSSRQTLETARSMHEVAMQALAARGRRENCPVVLVGNLDPSLAADDGDDNDDGKPLRSRARQVTGAEAKVVAEAWGTRYFEVDTSQPGAANIDESILYVGQRVRESAGLPPTRLYVDSIHPVRHRGTWFRKVVGHLLPTTGRK